MIRACSVRCSFCTSRRFGRIRVVVGAPAQHIARDEVQLLLRADVVALAALAADNLHDGAAVDIELVGAQEAHAAALGTAQAGPAALRAGVERAGLIAILAAQTGVDGETAVAATSTAQFAFGAALVRKFAVDRVGVPVGRLRAAP